MSALLSRVRANSWLSFRCQKVLGGSPPPHRYCCDHSFDTHHAMASFRCVCMETNIHIHMYHTYVLSMVINSNFYELPFWHGICQVFISLFLSRPFLPFLLIYVVHVRSARSTSTLHIWFKSRHWLGQPQNTNCKRMSICFPPYISCR